MVTTAQASITSLRLLKTARSSGEPLAGSNCSSVSGAMGAAVPAFMSRSFVRPRITVCTPRGPASASRPGPALATAAAGVGRSIFRGAKLAPSSLLASTCPAWLTMTMRPRSSRVLAVRPTPTPVGDALPGGAAIGAANDVAAQPVADHGPALADQAEQGAGVGQRHRGEAAAVAVELQRQALLADGEQLAADAAHRVEVQALGVVGRMQQRLPALAAVGGAQHQAEGADDEAGAVVVEPDVEERVLGALRREPLRLGEPLGVAAAGVVGDEHLAEAATVELAGPGAAGVDALQHHAVMAHGPAGRRRSGSTPPPGRR